jgi:hypothetical protein
MAVPWFQTSFVLDTAFVHQLKLILADALIEILVDLPNHLFDFLFRPIVVETFEDSDEMFDAELTLSIGLPAEQVKYMRQPLLLDSLDLPLHDLLLDRHPRLLELLAESTITGIGYLLFTIFVFPWSFVRLTFSVLEAFIYNI